MTRVCFTHLSFASGRALVRSYSRPPGHQPRQPETENQHGRDVSCQMAVLVERDRLTCHQQTMSDARPSGKEKQTTIGGGVTCREKEKNAQSSGHTENHGEGER